MHKSHYILICLFSVALPYMRGYAQDPKSALIHQQETEEAICNLTSWGVTSTLTPQSKLGYCSDDAFLFHPKCLKMISLEHNTQF